MNTPTFLRWLPGIAALLTVGIVIVGQASSAQSSPPLFWPQPNCTRIAKLQERSWATNRVKRLVARCAARMQSSSSMGRTWGAYVGWDAPDGPAFDTMIGTPMGIRATFVHWGNESEFPSYLAESLQGKTLLIFWEAMDYDKPPQDQAAFSYAAILRGDWDAYFTAFAADARDYGGPVILVPFEEMNGDWYAWSGTADGNTPAKHIAAYRYIRAFFSDAPNVKFGWAVNSDSVPDTPENGIAAYYPGDAYVDYVGVDGFNFGTPWMTFEEIFGSALRQLRTYGKPVYIFSIATAEGPRKAAWITDALTTQIRKYPEIAGWIWFNENKEHDWRIWSDAASLEAFQKAILR